MQLVVKRPQIWSDSDRFIVGRAQVKSEMRDFVFNTTEIKPSDSNAAWKLLVASAMSSGALPGSRVLDVSHLTRKDEHKRALQQAVQPAVFRDLLFPNFQTTLEAAHLRKLCLNEPKPVAPKLLTVLDAPGAENDFYKQSVSCNDHFCAIILQGRVVVTDAVQDRCRLAQDRHVFYLAPHDERYGKVDAVAFSKQSPGRLWVATSRRWLLQFDVSELQGRLLSGVRLTSEHLGTHVQEVKGVATELAMPSALETMPDGTVWVGSKHTGRIVVVRAKGTTILRSWTAHESTNNDAHVCHLKCSSDGEYVASGGNDNKVHVFHRNTDARKCSLTFDAGIKALAWADHKAWDGTRLLAIGSGTADTSLRVWNVSDDKPVAHILTRSQITGVCWNPMHRSQLITSHGFNESFATPLPHRITSTAALNVGNGLAAWSLLFEKDKSSYLRFDRVFGQQEAERILSLHTFNQGRSLLTLRAEPAKERIELWHAFGELVPPPTRKTVKPARGPVLNPFVNAPVGKPFVCEIR